jgi:hypothetical protein
MRTKQHERQFSEAYPAEYRSAEFSTASRVHVAGSGGVTVHVHSSGEVIRTRKPHYPADECEPSSEESLYVVSVFQRAL